MFKVRQPITDSLDVSDDVVEALGCRVGQPLVGEVGDLWQPVPERADQASQVPVDERPGLADPGLQDLFHLPGIAGRLEACMEVITHLNHGFQQRAVVEGGSQPGLLGHRRVGLEQIPANVYEGLHLRLLAPQSVQGGLDEVEAVDHAHGLGEEVMADAAIGGPHVEAVRLDLGTERRAEPLKVSGQRRLRVDGQHVQVDVPVQQGRLAVD